MSPKEEKKMFTSAVTTFLTGAAMVLTAAFYYCIRTENTLAMTLLSAGVGVIAILLVFVLRK